jgi:hypothetical protein
MKLMMEAERKMARQEAAQQAVIRVVGRAGRFNGNDFPFFLEAYNEEMDARGVGEALKLEFFCRAVVEPIRAEVKELRKAHESWESFKGALLEVCGYAEPEVRGRREFDRCVASAKRQWSAIEAFQEFERRFSQLSEWEWRSVGADNVRLFLKTVHNEERVDILFELQYDYGAHGLTSDWSEVEWVFRQHDASRSATTQPASGGEERELPPEERSSTRAGSEGPDLGALIWEACGLVMEQIEAEEELVMESSPRGSGRDPEEGASSHTKDEAYVEAGRERYIGTTGEGVEQATLSACGQRTVMEEAGDYEFRTHRSETSYGEANGIGACVIGDMVAANNDVRMEAATDMMSGGAGGLPTPILGTTAAGPSARVRPTVTDGGGGGEAGCKRIRLRNMVKMGYD